MPVNPVDPVQPPGFVDSAMVVSHASARQRGGRGSMWSALSSCANAKAQASSTAA